MEDTTILSSPLENHKAGEMWRTPGRAKVRGMRAAGKSYNAIKKLTGLPRSTIQGIVYGPSRTTRKGKSFKPMLLKPAEIQRIFRFVSVSWTNRTNPGRVLRPNLNLQPLPLLFEKQ